MLRVFAVGLLLSGTPLVADEPGSVKLAAPAGWGGETIKLPPGFAPDMKLKGSEHIRFAPGMMKPASDSFFCYAFAFVLEPEPVLTEAVVKDELLKYYRGLSKAVSQGKNLEVDLSKFALQLRREKLDSKPSSKQPSSKQTSSKQPPSKQTRADGPLLYTATLDWVEPFATNKTQRLYLEIRTWARNNRNYMFVCASPKTRESVIWKQLHTIRDDYLKQQVEATSK